MSERHLGHHYLREWRHYRGLSLRQLAERMERAPGEPLMSHANIGRVEKFEQPYNQELLEAAAVALDCSVTDILTVNPSKDGTVIDLMQLLRQKDPQTVRAILEGLPSKTGT